MASSSAGARAPPADPLAGALTAGDLAHLVLDGGRQRHHLALADRAALPADRTPATTLAQSNGWRSPDLDDGGRGGLRPLEGREALAARQARRRRRMAPPSSDWLESTTLESR